MASVAVDKLSTAEKEQLAVSYAAFVLNGQGAAVDADSLKAVLKAASVEVSSSLINAFAKTLQNRNISDFFGSVGGGGSAPAASSSSGSAPAKATEKVADAPAAVPEPAE